MGSARGASGVFAGGSVGSPCTHAGVASGTRGPVDPRSRISLIFNKKSFLRQHARATARAGARARAVGGLLSMRRLTSRAQEASALQNRRHAAVPLHDGGEAYSPLVIVSRDTLEIPGDQSCFARLTFSATHLNPRLTFIGKR